mmetsp:Transcript_8642/g.18940  ORF Transcript_8642/g.18940 Transcript_8642/m.18940 type:complete len:222 (-) Transcript_8642:16-681(-)
MRVGHGDKMPAVQHHLLRTVPEPLRQQRRRGAPPERLGVRHGPQHHHPVVLLRQLGHLRGSVGLRAAAAEVVGKFALRGAEEGSLPELGRGSEGVVAVGAEGAVTKQGVGGLLLKFLVHLLTGQEGPPTPGHKSKPLLQWGGVFEVGVAFGHHRVHQHQGRRCARLCRNHQRHPAPHGVTGDHSHLSPVHPSLGQGLRHHVRCGSPPHLTVRPQGAPAVPW